jgi:hypothetical protein
MGEMRNEYAILIRKFEEMEGEHYKSVRVQT